MKNKTAWEACEGGEPEVFDYFSQGTYHMDLMQMHTLHFMVNSLSYLESFTSGFHNKKELNKQRIDFIWCGLRWKHFSYLGISKNK